MSRNHLSWRVRDAIARLPVIQRVRTFRFTGRASARQPLLRRAEDRYGSTTPIVAQPPATPSAHTDAAQQTQSGWRRLVVVPVGILGAVALVTWWLWPKLSTEGLLLSTAQAVATAAPNAVPTDLAQGRPRLQPTFTPTAATLAGEQSLAAAAQAVPMQVVVVTATPDPNRRIMVAGAPVARPLARAAGEDPAPADGMARTAELQPLLPPPPFDPAQVVVPPVVEEVTSGPLPAIEVIPLPGLEPIVTPPPAPTPEPLPTPLPELYIPSRQWADFEPAMPEQNDHFWIGQAFVAGEFNQIGAPSYQFGSTGGGRYRPHHGLDVANPWGAPVRSGVNGAVVHAGMDDPTPIGPYPNFYGNTIVILLDQKLNVGGGAMDVFLVYGHLSRVTVAQGQQVTPGDIVGEVGMTGIAIGPHLHIEVRVGVNDYQHSVNPYLWLAPLPGNGAVAVRLLTADGRSWPGARLTLARFEDGRAVWGRQIETYLDNEGIGPNPSWGENGAMGDVPAGYYVLVGNVNGESVRAEFFVRAGQTTFVEIRTNQ